MKREFLPDVLWRWRLVLVGPLFVTVGMCSTARGQEAKGDQLTESHALLIGIEQYVSANRLPGVLGDVRRLRDTLQTRGGYRVRLIENSARTASTGLREERSERDTLQQAISDWLGARQESDAVILYFSGHGFRDPENRLYLAAVDCDPRNPTPGGLAIGWLREQLAACPAREKMLILDTCHAGSARSADAPRAVTAKELGDFFEQTWGLITLASCSGDQRSHMWEEKRMSVFTYWLVQGLSGHADREPLGEITVNELEDFVTRKVRWTAKELYQAEQTPTRLQGPDVTQDVVLRLRSVNLKTLLDDMAEQMDVLIRLSKADCVGVVPEFASDAAGTVLGREYGALATYVPVELANRLAAKAEGEYRVVNTNAVREMLQSRGVTARDVGTAKSRDLRLAEHEVSKLVAGHVQGLRGESLSLQCRLLDLSHGGLLGTAGGLADLNPSELAQTGISGTARPPQPADSVLARVREEVPVAAQHPVLEVAPRHPLSDPTFRYQVRIGVKGADGRYRVREPSFRGQECLVRLQRSEVFRIQIKNLSNQEVFARVLVDGLNTLPEKSQTKFALVEATEGETRRQAQPVNLAEARAWGPFSPQTEYQISGFFLRVGADAVYDEFQVVDASRSLAADAGYTQQLGLITVAFYQPRKKQPPPVAGSRSLGVGRGDRYQTQTEMYSGPNEPGPLLATVTIRYGE